MPRYFLEITYKGTAYSGFQSQYNTEKTIQATIEKAFAVLQKGSIILTGSSRTDAGVHAVQNFFHFDFEEGLHPHFLYKINAILPADIVVKGVYPMHADAHCRFDAITREYKYFIYRQKQPFLQDRAYYYPYTLNKSLLEEAASVIIRHNDFTSFSKRNTQVKTFLCTVEHSEWRVEGDCLVYHVIGNRFLRGMVRALVGTMLLVGREKLSIEAFENVIRAKDCTKANFGVPPQGLFLQSVGFPENYFSDKI